ncbi:hypothetical protein TWF225_000383 [Orbilia oligospora]|nr:hypothetical protein TWF225_000383 [Orbilia oligospora]KAF3254116.1 hypothetical protein TWF128_006246 [Orbilia oligospora]KAF3297779.1 hypothetical protein TWF132_006176 [Orbilia oligospora]
MPYYTRVPQFKPNRPLTGPSLLKYSKQRYSKQKDSKRPSDPSTTWNPDIFETIHGLYLQKSPSLRTCKVLLSQHLPRSLAQDIGCNEPLLRNLLGGIDEDEQHRLIVRLGRVIFYMDGMALLSLGCPSETQTFVDGMNALLSDGFLADLSLEEVIEGADINIYWPKIHRAALAGDKEVIGYALYKVAVEAKATVLSGEWKEMSAFYCSTSYEMARGVIMTSDFFLTRVLAASNGIHLNLSSCAPAEPPKEQVFRGLLEGGGVTAALEWPPLLPYIWKFIRKAHFYIFAGLVALEALIWKGIRGRLVFAFVHYEICLVILLLGFIDDYVVSLYPSMTQELND